MHPGENRILINKSHQMDVDVSEIDKISYSKIVKKLQWNRFHKILNILRVDTSYAATSSLVAAFDLPKAT